jgi:hypothetical protein
MHALAGADKSIYHGGDVLLEGSARRVYLAMGSQARSYFINYPEEEGMLQ